MAYRDYYVNEITKLVLESDGENLTGLWFDGSQDGSKHSDTAMQKDLPIFAQTKKWLDSYFSGKNPDFVPKTKINNLTPFRSEVYEIMSQIPYGQTMTYGELQKFLQRKKESKKGPLRRLVGQLEQIKFALFFHATALLEKRVLLALVVG